MNVRQNIATLLLIGATSSAQAQGVWTVDRCMAYAVEHSTAVRTQQIDARQAQSDYRLAKLSFLPTVSGGVSGQYSWGRGVDPETNTYNNVTTFNNYYQLYASLDVFDGFRTINAFKQARLARQTAQTRIDKARDAKAIEVMQSYADAVYAQASIRLAADKLDESRRILQKTKRMFDLGEKSKPDVAQAEAQVAADDYNLTHQRNEARRTLLALKAVMNYPINDSLSLDSTTAVCPRLAADDASSLYESFSQISPEVLSAQADARSSRYDYLQQRASLMPSVSLSGGVTTSFYKNLSLKGTAESFASQFRNNRGEYLSVSLSIPLFDPSTWRGVRRAKSAWQKAEITLDETRRRLHDDIAQAVMDRDGYAKEVIQMERKAQSDSIAHHLNSRKYEEGMLSTFELRTSSNTLLESRIRLLQMRLLYAMKERLVDYYKGRPLVRK